MISNMLPIETERKVIHMLRDGKTMTEISFETGISGSTILAIRDHSVPRNLKRKMNTLSKKGTKLLKIVKCPDCGGRIYEWPCLYCNPDARAYVSGPMKQSDGGTVIRDGIQIAGNVITPSAEKVVELVRIARSIIEMHNDGMLKGVLLRHLVTDAKAALLVTENRKRKKCRRKKAT